MDRPLLERDQELRALGAAVREATSGRSSVVVVDGEAGIGKTSLVRAFVATLGPSAHLLAGGCDDLLTPRTFGPFRDAVAARTGPLAEALTSEPDREAVYRALLDELDPGSGRIAVLVVEDVHWADDATVDALRYLVPRLDGLSCIMILTFRADEVTPDHPLRRLLGALAAAPLTRLSLSPLSRRAVERMGAGSRAAALHAATAGNPFFVTEVLACPDIDVPTTVVDAVVARVRSLPAPTRQALEQLAVVPSHAEPWLVDALLGGPEVLADAEQSAILEVGPHGFAFRHDLARRALLRSIPVTRQVGLNRAVVEVLLGHDGVDPARLVHHAMAGRDGATVLAFGPAAAREAARAGSHREALHHYEHVMSHGEALPADELAHVLAEYSWQLYAAQRHDEAVDAARRAVDLWEAAGDPIALGETLVVLSRSSFMADRPIAAMSAAQRAVDVLRPTKALPAIVQAETHLGAVLALTDSQPEAMVRLAATRTMAEQAGRTDLVALCLNYLGCARVDLGDPAGVEDLEASLAMSLAQGQHEYAARAYTNLGEVLFALRRYDELEVCIERGLRFADAHDLPGHSYNLMAHRAMLLTVRGEWAGAESRLRRLVAAVPDPGQLARLTLPPLGRLLARRGDPGAQDVLDQAWRLALRNGTLLALGPAGLARIEWAWLTGAVDRASEQVDQLLERTQSPAAARVRGELLGYLRRAGRPGTPFQGCPEEWAASLRGDWRAAAATWERIGDPYERALELGTSGDVAAGLEALDVLDQLGAVAAATLVRSRLRGLGVARIPRGRQPTTRANPGGLTDRQLDVLTLLADGLTNAEIAQRLVVSVRTVDHHVSAILTTMRVSSRREAARQAHQLGLAPASSG